MSWRQLALLAVLSIPFVQAAGILPDQLGSNRKKPAEPAALPGNPAIWKEFGFVSSDAASYGKMGITAYRFKDTTGALAGWEALRAPDGHPCNALPYCSQSETGTLVFDENYVLVLTGQIPRQTGLKNLSAALPNRRVSSLPAILTFVPRQDLTPNSARYILGPASLEGFAPELKSVRAGFDRGAEAHLTAYRINGAPVRLALFYYPTPEMARLRTADFKLAAGTFVKRSSSLVAVVLGAANEQQANTLLGRVQYEAKITWNDLPPPSPIKPLFLLLRNILLLSALLGALALTAGILYGCMRLYRRKYGQLESEEAMTTLGLDGH